MRKWAFIVAALGALLVGCDGGSGGGGGGVVPPPGSNLAQVNTSLLQTVNGAFGRVEVTYNTGQGRAPGSITAVLERLSFVAVPIEGIPAGDSRNNIDTVLSSINLGLDSYTSQTLAVNVPMSNLGFSGPLNSREIDNFTLDISRLFVEQAPGESPLVVENSNGAPVVLETFPAHIVAFAGRTTSLQVFLDDAMVFVEDRGFPEGLVAQFDRELFELVNFADIGNGPEMVSFLSDYVVFDISNVASKPEMSFGGFATHVWFSGDAIALSGSPVQGSAQPMEVLTPSNEHIEGLFSTPVPLPGGLSPGTYSLRQVDPRDISNLARITALQGTWRHYFTPANPSGSPFLNLGSFEAFTFPQSIEQEHHDLVVIARNAAGQIVNLYFGQVDFGSNTFSMWPISQVDDGDASNEVSGTVSNLLDRNGGTASSHRHVRSGNFNITDGGVPGGFSASGRFIVYRL